VNLLEQNKLKLEKGIETFKHKIPALAKKISLKNYYNLDYDKVSVMPEWLAKSIVSLEQKVGKIKNDISTADKKRKKKNVNSSAEDSTRQLEHLNAHKDKWIEIGNMTLDEDFLERNAENFESVKDSVQL